MAEHFAFLKSVAKATPKFTIPSPSMVHLRGGRNAISKDAYPDLGLFWDDVAAAYRKAIAHLAEMRAVELKRLSAELPADRGASGPRTDAVLDLLWAMGKEGTSENPCMPSDLQRTRNALSADT